MTTPLKIHGVDISHHQSGQIGWAALARAGVQWMMHKSTEGGGFIDSRYVGRRAEAKAAGMPFGAYHFAGPSPGDAREEARFFISVAKPLPGDLRPALDLEVINGMSGDAIDNWADNFCDEVEKLTGVFPWVYTPFTLSDSLERKALFWVPRYNSSNTPPTRPWDVWQCSNGVSGVPNQVNGIGHVDLNTSKVSLADLLIPKAAEEILSRGGNIDSAIEDLTGAEEWAKDGTERDKLVKRALRILKKIVPKKK